MKPLLLHGPAIVSSRKKLIEIKNKYDLNNVVVFEKGSDSKDVLNSLMTPSLLSEEQLIVWENPGELTFDSSHITHHTPLILWFDKEIDPKKFPNFEVLFFPESREISIFPFLDLLGSRSKQAFIEIEKLKKANFDTRYFITMIFYMLRNLIATPKNAKDFVREKNKNLRKNFKEGELRGIYKFILETDYKIKSGLLEPSYAEFLIVNKFISS